jgi:hypothetical protein
LSIKLSAVPRKPKSGSGHETLIAPGSGAETAPLTSEPSLIEKVSELNAGDGPGQAWVRAVEKFRRYEADLHHRVEKTKKTTFDATKASDRITVPTCDETRVVNKPPHTAVGERLRRRPCNGGPLERVRPDHEALRRFDEFWDNLVPPPSAEKSAELSGTPASLTPLARSVSLVVIEPKTAPGNKMRGKRGFKKMLQKLLHRLEGALP